MKMVEQKHNIFQISKELLELLESKGYSTGTLNNYRRALDSIALFMKERKMTEYTEGIGEAYFDDHISNWKIKKSRQKQIQTLLRRLDEFKNGVGYRDPISNISCINLSNNCVLGIPNNKGFKHSS